MQIFDKQIVLFLNPLVGRNEILDIFIVVIGQYLPYIALLPILGIAVAGFFEPYRYYQKKHWEVFFLAASAAVVARFAVVPAVRFFVERARPFEVMTLHKIIAHDAGGSFPSGHAAAAFAIASAIFWYYPRLAAVFWVFGVLMGIARVAAGVHWPSDIVAGALIGAGTAWVLRKILVRMQTDRG